ncbi:uncharacterized protein LOC130297297 [Hyla sarda]|uniref:uncharacterized protein LOC130297297 n=1 Tax=Hyla sarda TaxID=327740 RepID=UPI0024C3C672|nr:uncharacterized protein LOC130297297 [Hyla sarda]
MLLGWWEETVVFSDHHSLYHDSIVLWARYIDDIAIIWSGTPELFEQFVGALNLNNIGLRFTHEININSLNFLDVMLERNEEGGINTKVLRKPMTGNNLLRWESHHPLPLKKGIPKGKYYRIRHNCSSESAFKCKASQLRSRFKERGYPDKILRQAYQSAQQKERTSLLQPRDTVEDNITPPWIIATFDAAVTDRHIIDQYWPIFKSDPLVGQLVEDRAVVTYRRRSRNLRFCRFIATSQPPIKQHGLIITSKVPSDAVVVRPVTMLKSLKPSEGTQTTMSSKIRIMPIARLRESFI